MHRRGAFSVARFDYQGNARAFTSWTGHQDRLHVFCVYAEPKTNGQVSGVCLDMNDKNDKWILHLK